MKVSTLMIAALILLAACSSSATSNEMIKGAGFEGVILSGAPFYYGKADDYWKPSNEQIVEMEKNLKPYLIKELPRIKMQIIGGPDVILKDLPKYKRQYTGIIRKGRKIIHGNFFCDSFDIDWKKEQVMVMDGGSCYFQVEYDVDKKGFTNLNVNGEA